MAHLGYPWSLEVRELLHTWYWLQVNKEPPPRALALQQSGDKRGRIPSHLPRGLGAKSQEDPRQRGWPYSGLAAAHR